MVGTENKRCATMRRARWCIRPFTHQSMRIHNNDTFSIRFMRLHVCFRFFQTSNIMFSWSAELWQCKTYCSIVSVAHNLIRKVNTHLSICLFPLIACTTNPSRRVRERKKEGTSRREFTMDSIHFCVAQRIMLYYIHICIFCRRCRLAFYINF